MMEETKSKPKKKKARTVSVGREYFELFTETLIYVFFVMTFLLQSFVIPTGSMEDTLLIGDHLFVDKVAYSRSLGKLDGIVFPQTPIQRGMIVTFKPPHEMDKEYVKRVIALPGDTIQIVGKRVFLNGVYLDEPYVYHKGGYSIDYFPPESPDGWYEDFASSVSFPQEMRVSVVDTPNGKAFKVPEGHYFCMGDNRDNSFDCRFWGPVPADYIIGKPWRIYWSYDSKREEYLTPGILYKIKDILKTILNFFTKTRWSRTFMRIR